MRMYIINIAIPNPPNIKKLFRHNKRTIWITNRKSNNSHLKFPQLDKYNIYTDRSPSSQNQQDTQPGECEKTRPLERMPFRAGSSRGKGK